MAALEFNGQTIELDEDGFIQQPELWNVGTEKVKSSMC